jgi:hypothetical protein
LETDNELDGVLDDIDLNDSKATMGDNSVIARGGVQPVSQQQQPPIDVEQQQSPMKVN